MGYFFAGLRSILIVGEKKRSKSPFYEWEAPFIPIQDHMTAHVLQICYSQLKARFASPFEKLSIFFPCMTADVLPAVRC